MVKEKMLKALNKQLNEEMFSSYAYLAMSAYFEAENLSGFASWMRLQSQEETSHAMKIFDYIHEVNGKVTLQKIDVPKLNWKTPLEVFQDMLKQEQKVTQSIDELVEISMTEKDYATNNFLQWFVSEQVEEEAQSTKFLEKMKLVGDNKNGLFFLDREMGMRARFAKKGKK